MLNFIMIARINKNQSMKIILNIALLLLLFTISACESGEESVTSADIKSAVDSFNEANFEDALKFSNEILKEDSEDYFAWSVKGRSLFALGKKEEGIEALNKAILINPEYYEAYAHRGLFYYAMGEFEKAQKDVNVAIEDDAKNVELLKTKATISYALSDFENALKGYNQIILLDSNNYDTYVYRSICNDRLGNNDLVLIDLEKAISLDSENGFAYQTRAEHYTYSLKGNYEQAIKDYDKIISLFSADFPENEKAIAYNNRGFAKYNVGQLEEAINDIDQSLSLFSENSYAYKNRALVHLKKGNKSTACADLAKAKSLGFTEQYGNEVDELSQKKCN
jgi:tetratricopeptide (TPR) repeat protein